MCFQGMEKLKRVLTRKGLHYETNEGRVCKKRTHTQTHTHTHTDTQRHAQTDTRTDGQTDTRTDGQTGRHTHARTRAKYLSLMPTLEHW